MCLQARGEFVVFPAQPCRKLLDASLQPYLLEEYWGNRLNWLIEKLILVQAGSNCGEDEVDPLILMGYGVSFGHNALG